MRNSFVLCSVVMSTLSGTLPNAYSMKAFCSVGSGLLAHARKTASATMILRPSFSSSSSWQISCAIARNASNERGLPLRFRRGSTPLVKGMPGTAFLCRIGAVLLLFAPFGVELMHACASELVLRQCFSYDFACTLTICVLTIAKKFRMSSIPNRERPALFLRRRSVRDSFRLVGSRFP